jgi:hypothetical protein
MNCIENVVCIAYCGIARSSRDRAGKHIKRQKGEGRSMKHLDQTAVERCRLLTALIRNKTVAGNDIESKQKQKHSKKRNRV